MKSSFAKEQSDDAMVFRVNTGENSMKVDGNVLNLDKV